MQNIQDSFPLRQPEKAHLQSYKTAWLLFGGGAAVPADPQAGACRGPCCQQAPCRGTRLSPCYLPACCLPRRACPCLPLAGSSPRRCSALLWLWPCPGQLGTCQPASLGAHPLTHCPERGNHGLLFAASDGTCDKQQTPKQQTHKQQTPKQQTFQCIHK